MNFLKLIEVNKIKNLRDMLSENETFLTFMFTFQVLPQNSCSRCNKLAFLTGMFHSIVYVEFMSF